MTHQLTIYTGTQTNADPGVHPWEASMNARAESHDLAGVYMSMTNSGASWRTVADTLEAYALILRAAGNPNHNHLAMVERFAKELRDNVAKVEVRALQMGWRWRGATRECAECHEPVAVERAVDHSSRKVGVVVERWVCPGCDEAIHDEAMGQLP